MGAFFQVLRIDTRIILRSKVAVFWTFAFPMLLLFAEYKLGGSASPPDYDHLLSGVIAIIVVSSALMGFAAPLIQARETGILRACAVWPTSKPILLGAMATARLQVIALAVVVTIIFAEAALHLPLSGNAPLFIVVLLLGSVAMLMFATAVGARIAQVQSAIAICNLLYFGMIFVGEVFFKASDLPPDVANVLAWLPVNALVHGLTAAFHSNWPAALQPVLALTLFFVLCAVTAGKAFVWTSERKVKLIT